jgi:hypothetical protein
VETGTLSVNVYNFLKIKSLFFQSQCLRNRESIALAVRSELHADILKQLNFVNALFRQRCNRFIVWEGMVLI